AGGRAGQPRRCTDPRAQPPAADGGPRLGARDGQRRLPRRAAPRRGPAGAEAMTLGTVTWRQRQELLCTVLARRYGPRVARRAIVLLLSLVVAFLAASSNADATAARQGPPA